jgi:hypothetical protein
MMSAIDAAMRAMRSFWDRPAGDKPEEVERFCEFQLDRPTGPAKTASGCLGDARDIGASLLRFRLRTMRDE